MVNRVYSTNLYFCICVKCSMIKNFFKVLALPFVAPGGKSDHVFRSYQSS